MPISATASSKADRPAVGVPALPRHLPELTFTDKGKHVDARQVGCRAVRVTDAVLGNVADDADRRMLIRDGITTIHTVHVDL